MFDFVDKNPPKWHDFTSIRKAVDKISPLLSPTWSSPSVGKNAEISPSLAGNRFCPILLMEEILHHLGCIKPWGWTTYQLAQDFFPSTVVLPLLPEDQKYFQEMWVRQTDETKNSSKLACAKPILSIAPTKSNSKQTKMPQKKIQTDVPLEDLFHWLKKNRSDWALLLARVEWIWRV